MPNAISRTPVYRKIHDKLSRNIIPDSELLNKYAKAHGILAPPLQKMLDNLKEKECSSGKKRKRESSIKSEEAQLEVEPDTQEDASTSEDTSEHHEEKTGLGVQLFRKRLRHGDLHMIAVTEQELRHILARRNSQEAQRSEPSPTPDLPNHDREAPGETQLPALPNQKPPKKIPGPGHDLLDQLMDEEHQEWAKHYTARSQARDAGLLYFPSPNPQHTFQQPGSIPAAHHPDPKANIYQSGLFQNMRPASNMIDAPPLMAQGSIPALQHLNSIAPFPYPDSRPHHSQGPLAQRVESTPFPQTTYPAMSPHHIGPTPTSLYASRPQSLHLIPQEALTRSAGSGFASAIPDTAPPHSYGFYGPREYPGMGRYESYDPNYEEYLRRFQPHTGYAPHTGPPPGRTHPRGPEHE